MSILLLNFKILIVVSYCCVKDYWDKGIRNYIEG